MEFQNIKPLYQTDPTSDMILSGQSISNRTRYFFRGYWWIWDTVILIMNNINDKENLAILDRGLLKEKVEVLGEGET